MKTFYFGDAGKQLYGVYSPPQRRAVHPRAVLLCHPIGHEYIYAYRALRELAQGYAAEGMHVLRFDYFGTGNSAGDSREGTIAQWRDDIRDAVEELDELADGADLCVVGLRIGASLAALASATLDGVTSLVLWDPIVDGARYLTALEAAHEQVMGSSSTSDRPSDELMGFSYPEALKTGVGEIDLTASPLVAERIVLVASEGNEETDTLRAHLKRSGANFDLQEVSGQLRWQADGAEPQALRSAGETMRALLNAINGSAP